MCLIGSIFTKGVDIQLFWRHFTGTFNKKYYDSPLPPPSIFPNNSSCRGFEAFITNTILERVTNGSLQVIGQVDQVDPPHLVLPLTIEPSKPRLCHDERFLNLWIRDLPFKLDTLTDLPRYVERGHYQTVLDDKSGYDHILLTSRSSTYFGLQWAGWYFCFRTIPFGWKASAYIYHTVGLAATSYIRSMHVPCSQYIDDRHTGQLRLSPISSTHSTASNFALAEAAAYIVCYVLVELGYFIGLKKSILVPRLIVPFLGFLSNSELQAFILPQEKLQKFIVLRESVLAKKSVGLKNLQKLGGKMISFGLAVPASRLYASAIFKAISTAISTGRAVPLKGDLLDEISSWRFLDTWSGFLPWRLERHFRVCLCSDASNSGWGGVVYLADDHPTTVRGPWGNHERSAPIVVRETLALVYTLNAVADKLVNARLDCYVDSMTLIQAWQRQGSRSPALTLALKELFIRVTLRYNFTVTLHHIPGAINPADFPSRILSDLDCSLTLTAWQQIQRAYGPHTVDLMALPANVLPDTSGQPLKFFSPFPVQGAAGVNVFAQCLAPSENAYVFPPFVLIGPLLKFLEGQHISYSIVVPDLSPRRYWWPLLSGSASASFCLGNKGDTGTLRFPSPEGFTPRPLQWDIWVFRVSR